MHIHYDSSEDILYLRLDPRKQSLINRRLMEDVMLDIGEDDKIVGIEFLDASDRLNLQSLLPIEFGPAIESSH